MPSKELLAKVLQKSGADKRDAGDCQFTTNYLKLTADIHAGAKCARNYLEL